MAEKKGVDNDVPKPPGPSAVEIQQEYYEAIGGVDWELYKKSDRKFLLQKVAVALYGPPTKEGNLELEPGDKSHKNTSVKKDNKNTQPSDDLKLQGYELRDEEGIMVVFDKICEQAKYSQHRGDILIQILRVVCVVPKEEVPFYKITPDDYWVNLHNKNGDRVHTYIFHVFCLRKCISMKQGAPGCRVYIDHDARVYKDWASYLENNKLPKSVMVVPKDGLYSATFESIKLGDLQLDDMPRVKLSVVPSPALGLGAKVLAVTDTISTVANVGALVAIGGAIAAPAIAPVAIGAAVGVGIITGSYAIGRATASLIDRSIHEQKIGLDDSEARSYWINILVSTAGISCSAAGKLLSWAAASGTNVKILMNAVNILQYANLGSGVVGVANSLGEMIIKYNKYDETPSGLEVFQLTTSLLFLGLGAMSNQTAKDIVQDAQANKINEVRESLSSNNKKKMFDKITAETRRTQGTIQGNTEVIQALKKIENKDEFFGKLRGMNKQLNKNNLRISLSSDGNPLINNQHNIKVADLQALGKSGREQLFAKYGPATVNSKNAPIRIYASTSAANGSNVQQNSVFAIRPEEILKVSKFIISLSQLDQEFVAELLSNFSATVHDAFLLLCAEFIDSLIPSEIAQLISHDKVYRIRVILFIFDFLKSKIPVDYSDDNISFTNVLKRYIRDGRIPKETILEIKRVLFDRISKSKKLFDDPHLFDVMHDYDTRRYKKFLVLQAGEVLKVGDHDILIKSRTIDKLKDWFHDLSMGQVKTDTVLDLCFQIISSLSAKELSQLNEINLDDDVVKLITEYLLFKVDGLADILNEECRDHTYLVDIAHELKQGLMKWRMRQRLREYETCKICRGRLYI